MQQVGLFKCSASCGCSNRTILYNTCGCSSEPGCPCTLVLQSGLLPSIGEVQAVAQTPERSLHRSLSSPKLSSAPDMKLTAVGQHVKPLHVRPGITFFHSACMGKATASQSDACVRLLVSSLCCMAVVRHPLLGLAAGSWQGCLVVTRLSGCAYQQACGMPFC